LKKYSIIYADPPWPFNFQNRKGLSDDAKANLYSTMKAQDIVALPVGSIADANCVLFLWVMNSELPLALRCIEAWGLPIRLLRSTGLRRQRRANTFSAGGTGRVVIQNCAYWQRKKSQKRKSASVRELVVSPRREHSRKPDEIREMIVWLCGDVPRVELFCRYPEIGWDVWGNEVECTAELGSAV